MILPLTLAYHLGVLIADIADAVDLDWSFVAEGRRRWRRRARARSRASCAPTRCPRSSTTPAVAPLAHRSGGLGTVYLGFPDESFPLDHPQQWLGHYDVGAVAYDLFPPTRRSGGSTSGPSSRGSSPRSSASTRSSPTPIRSARLNLAVMTDGDQLQWHFDQTDFVVSLAIQDADDVGGDFEVAPQIRTADDEHYDDVARVLAGERDRWSRCR